MVDPRDIVKKAAARGTLADKIAGRIKEAERQLAAGPLERKEIRNIVDAVLREEGIDG